MNAVIGFAQVLLRQRSQIGMALTRHGKRILNNGKKTSALMINDILNFLRIGICRLKS